VALDFEKRPLVPDRSSSLILGNVKGTAAPRMRLGRSGHVSTLGIPGELGEPVLLSDAEYRVSTLINSGEAASK